MVSCTEEKTGELVGWVWFVGASVGLGEAGWVVWCISPRFLEFWQLDCLLYRLASL